MSRILLLESDKMVAGNIKRQLTKNQHQVEWQRQPQAAIDSADVKTPDLVIIDLLLAGRSGVEFIYEFRSYPEWQKIPVIIYSDVSPDEFEPNSSGFSELVIAAHHCKPTTSLVELAASVETALQPG